MESMRINLESRESIHFGINYVFVPAPILDPKKCIAFQKSLTDAGVDLPSVKREEKELHLVRETPHFDVLVKMVGPQVGQLLMTSDCPEGALIVFAKEADQICKAYEKTWGTPVQFVDRDAAIHSLFSCVACEHSFQFLWERLLDQKVEDAQPLGHVMLGGGLRFVMPPEEDETPEPTSREVKIETFLREPAKVFVVTHLSWPQPVNENMFNKCSELLNRVETYATNEVAGFLTHKERES